MCVLVKTGLSRDSLVFPVNTQTYGVVGVDQEGIFRTAYLGIVSIVWRRRGHLEDAPIRVHLAPKM
jgi:hypothetical protein